MFGFIEKFLIGLLSACTEVPFGRSVPPKEPIKCLTSSDRPCQARPTLVNMNSNETLFIHLLLVMISVMEVLTLLMICMMNYVFQIK